MLAESGGWRLLRPKDAVALEIGSESDEVLERDTQVSTSLVNVRD